MRPVTGEVVEVNEAIVANPELVNKDPEGDAWFLKIRIGNPRELDGLMSAEAYARISGDRRLMRYLPHTADERRQMLAEIGVSRCRCAVSRRAASNICWTASRGCPRHQSELAVERALAQLAARNLPAGSAPFFVGCGAYKHHVPATVDHIIQRSEFMTAYTPYQPEIAQGTLQYLFEFQTQVAALTGMEVANASMYDGSTAAAEAVLMAHRITKRGKAVLFGNLHPHYRAVIETISRYAAISGRRRCRPRRIPNSSTAIDSETSCVVVQYPGVFGGARDLTALAELAHESGALLIVVVTEADVLRRAALARLDGRRHRRRGRPVDRQRAEFRRPLCRPVRGAAEIPPADAAAGCAARRWTRRASAASC